MIQMLVLLAQILPDALKLLSAWQDYHGAKLTREHRQRLADDIGSAVDSALKSRDTSGIENLLKNLGKPPTKKVAAPNPQEPS